MKRAVGIYRQLLRMYPPGFRADYADEMEQVFAQAVEEGGGWLTLLAEIRDLPVSALREHLRESRRSVLVLEGGSMVVAGNFKRTFNFCLWAILLGSMAYLVLVALPFFVFGLHLQPEKMVRGGAFDPKGYLFYGDRGSGNPLLVITYFITLVSPVWQFIFGVSLIITLTRYWRLMLPWQRFTSMLTLITSIGVIGFTFSPIGHLIMTWWLD
jgi:hypothetical protein